MALRIPVNQIELLEVIGIQWMSEKTDKKLQFECIDESNYHRKKIELLNRANSFLNQLILLGTNEITSKDDIDYINNEFEKQLTLTKK